jgi:hypothetical protein
MASMLGLCLLVATTSKQQWAMPQANTIQEERRAGRVEDLIGKEPRTQAQIYSNAVGKKKEGTRQRACAELPQKIYAHGGRWTAPKRLCNVQNVAFSAPCDRKWVPEGTVCSRLCSKGLASDAVPIMCGRNTTFGACTAVHEELRKSSSWHASDYDTHRCLHLDEVPTCKVVDAGSDSIDIIADEAGGIQRSNWQKHCEVQRGVAPMDWVWWPSECSLQPRGGRHAGGWADRAGGGVDPHVFCKSLKGNVLFVGDSLSSMMRASMIWLLNPVSHYQRRRKSGSDTTIDACKGVGSPFGQKRRGHGFYANQVSGLQAHKLTNTYICLVAF